MARRHGDHARRLSELERRELRRRVAEGETFASAALAVGCSTKSVSRLIARNGGLRQRASARSLLRLSLANREELSRGLVAGDSLRALARRMGRSVATLTREVARNGGRATYRAWQAETAAARRARRPKPAKLALHTRLRRAVERRLLQRWSPQQIAARLVIDYPRDHTMRVSHETIYQTLFVQARGALRKELTSCLRTRRTQRRAHQRTAYKWPRTNPGHGAYQRQAQRGRGSRDSRTLGGRPPHGAERPIRDRHIGGTGQSVCRARASAPWADRRARACRPHASGRAPTRGPAALSPGIKARRWPSTHVSRSTPPSRSTSATHTARGSVGAMRTPTGYSVSTSPPKQT
jgi:hypothetical protein